MRLSKSPGETFDPVPHSILKKYVSYARKYVYPKMQPEAAVGGQRGQYRQLESDDQED